MKTLPSGEAERACECGYGSRRSALMRALMAYRHLYTRDGGAVRVGARRGVVVGAAVRCLRISC